MRRLIDFFRSVMSVDDIYAAVELHRLGASFDVGIHDVRCETT